MNFVGGQFQNNKKIHGLYLFQEKMAAAAIASIFDRWLDNAPVLCCIVYCR